MGFICVLSIDLHFEASGSLKSKRKQLQSIKKQLANRFGAAVAEVEHQDLWQRSELLVALVSESSSELDRRVNALESYLSARLEGASRVERKLMSLNDIR